MAKTRGPVLGSVLTHGGEAEGLAGNGPPHVDYDALDRARDNQYMDFEGLDEFLKGGEEPGLEEMDDGARIKALEQSLEEEKRRLNAMESELLEAKRQRAADQQIVVVKKQSKVVENVMGQLTKLTKEEAGERAMLEAEWRQRTEEFSKQHREMEAALKKRHVGELKRLQSDIQRDISRLASEIDKTKGRRMPSPRTMTRLQAENLERLVKLFHRHAEERLHLAEKVSRQEELILRSKNQSLQRLLEESQMRSGQVYQRYGLHGVNQKEVALTMSSNQGSEVGDFAQGRMSARSRGGGGNSSHGSAAMRTGRSQAETSAPHDIKGPMQTAVRRLGYTPASPPGQPVLLTSPRIDDDSSTFLTETEIPDYYRSSQTRMTSPAMTMAAYSQPSSAYVHGGIPPATAPVGSLGASSLSWQGQAHSPERRALEDTQGSHTESPGRRKQGQAVGTRTSGQPVARTQLSYGDQASRAVQYPIAPHPSDFGPVYGNSGTLPSDLPMPGSEASGWRPFREEHKETTRPPWNSSKRNSYLSQATTPVYAQGTVESVIKKKSASPYLVSQLADHDRSVKGSRSARVQPRDSARAARQASQRDAMPRSISARLPEPMRHSSSEGGDSPPGLMTDASSKPRSKGTVPDSQWDNSPTKTVGRTSFPRLAPDASARQSESERPRTDVDGKSDGKFAQLENWIDDKIKNLMGDSVNLTKSERPRTTVRMREVDAQGIRRELDSRGHVLSTSPTDDGERASMLPEVTSGKGGQGQRRPSIQRRGSQNDAEEQENVSHLLSRLKKTINTDPQQRPDGMPPKSNLKSSSFKGGSEGFQVKDSKELEKKKQSSIASNAGRAVAQDADAEALNDERDRKGTLMERGTSRATESRRGLLEELEGERKVMSPKTPKRVVWSMNQEEVEYENLGDWDGNADIFRPETGTTSRSSRPTTGISTMASFRPETSNTRPDTEDADQEPQDNATKGAPTFTESEFYTWVRHNKLAEVEVAFVQGRDVDKRDEHGNTALMLACQNGHKRMVKLCLKFAAEPNMQNHQGNTPLHFCHAYGYKEVAEYLVSKGADDTIMNNFGRAAADGRLQ